MATAANATAKMVFFMRGQIIVGPPTRFRATAGQAFLMGRTLVSVAALSLLFATPVFAQEKGGEDETGAYEVVANWPQPWSPAGYIWGSQPAVFAESPDRIFIGVRGEIKAPATPPRGFNGSGDRPGSARPIPRPKCATA